MPDRQEKAAVSSSSTSASSFMLPVWSNGRVVSQTVVKRPTSRLAFCVCVGFAFVVLYVLLFGTGIGKPSTGQVFLLLPATQSSPRFCKTLASLVLNDYDNIILTNWQGEVHHRAKIFSTLEFITRNVTKTQVGDPLYSEDTAASSASLGSYLPSTTRMRGGDDIVIVIDAYDTIAQQPLSHVISTYKNNFNGADVVFSAEKGCHPMGGEWCEQVPDSPLPKWIYGSSTDNFVDLQNNRPRWLNSGFVIGRAHALGRLYDAAAKMATEQQGQFTADQAILGPLFVSGDYHTTLDYKSEISQPMFFYDREVHFSATTTDIDSMHNDSSIKAVFNEAYNAASKPNVHAAAQRWTYGTKDESAYNWPTKDVAYWQLRNAATGTTPAFVHFNVPQKEALDNHWRTYWYGGQNGEDVMKIAARYVERVGKVTRAEDGQVMPFTELCTGEWYR